MKNIPLIILTLFIAVIFTLTLKGNLGNPSPENILDNLRVRGQPFELSPERGRYALTSSLAEDKSFYLKKNIAEYVTPDLGYVDGKFIILFSPGVSILATPLYLLGQKIGAAQVLTFSLPVFFAIFNFLLIVKIAKQFRLSERNSFIAGLSFLFATTAFSYSISFYQHQITTFLLLATCALLFSKRTIIKLTLAAFLIGASFWIDSQNPIFFIPLIGYFIFRVFNFVKTGKSAKVIFHFKYLLTILGLVAALGSYSLYSYKVFHRPFQLGGTVGSAGSLSESIQSPIKPPEKKKVAVEFFNPRRMMNGTSILLFSTDRGVVLYAPIILLSLFGIKNLFEKEKQKAAVVGGIILFIFALYTMWGDPWGGWAFGPRYMVPVFGLSSIFLVSAIDAYWNKLWFKAILSLLFVYSVAINLLGALTTNQIPPKIEAIPLGMKWNYLLNWQMLISGQTSSFFYKSFLQNTIPVLLYSALIFAAIIVLGVFLVWHPKWRLQSDIN